MIEVKIHTHLINIERKQLLRNDQFQLKSPYF
jgi:hypothetical protein